MEALEAIFSRRSIRKFRQKKVSDADITLVLKAAMYAPSAANTQPWEFVVINDLRVLKQIMEFHPYAKMLEEVNVAILVCGNTNKQLAEGYWPVDCAAATQNMLLAAHAIGLGAVWLGIYPRSERIASSTELFQLPDHIHPFSVVALGYPDEDKKDTERFDQSRVHYNSW